MRRAAALVVLVLAVAAGIAVVADGGEDERRAAAASRPDARLALARPVTPRTVGPPPRALEIMRLRVPGEDDVAVTIKRVVRPEMPRRYRHAHCLDAVRVPRLATHRFRASVGCRPLSASATDPAGGLAYSLTSGRGVATRIGGFAPPGARRMTVAGVGPTVDLPLGREGAWYLEVAEGVRTTLTLTAELGDGTTRFHRLRIPSGPVPPDAVEVPDPVDGATWSVTAEKRAGGQRSGQTCVQFFRLDRRGHQGGFGAPLCGDLRREPIVLDAHERGPGPRTTFGGGPEVERRMVVFGAASDGIRSLRAVAAGRTHDVRINEDRSFVLVLPPDVRREDVTVEATLADGTERTWRGPRRVGAAELHAPGVRVTTPLRARVDRARDRVPLSLRVAGRPRSVTVVFQTHRVRLRHRGGGFFAGAVRYRRGVPARHRPGARFVAHTVICAPGCVNADARGRLR